MTWCVVALLGLLWLYQLCYVDLVFDFGCRRLDPNDYCVN